MSYWAQPYSWIPGPVYNPFEPRPTVDQIAVELLSYGEFRTLQLSPGSASRRGSAPYYRRGPGLTLGQRSTGLPGS